MYSKKLLSDISRFLPNSPKIVIALSGGPDSIFLGELFASAVPKKSMIVAHFDHQLREESAKDRDFCKDWAEKKGICFVSDRWKTPSHSEEKARKARHRFLYETAEKYRSNAIALGTHADDEAETIFFNFLRGSGLSGLSGIGMFEKTTKLFRPLLRYSKQEIIKYLDKSEIEYVIDQSNFASDYSRNFLRNDIFPQLENRFSGFSERIRRQAEIFERMDDFLRKSAEDFLQTQIEKISRKDFEKLHPILQAEIVRRLFAPKNLDFVQTENLRDFICAGKSGKKMSVGKRNITLYSEYFFVEREEEIRISKITNYNFTI